VKGFAHYVSGIAVASFLPGVVELSAGGGFPLLLAGLGAILPDVLDFRLARFLQPVDGDVALDAEDPAPQTMAEQIATAADRASSSGRRMVLRLAAARTTDGLWRRYSVSLGSQVRVRIGPLVSTSGALGRRTMADGKQGTTQVAQPVELDYGQAVQVDAFAGPSFALEPVKGGTKAIFLPWHRTWSHSLLLAAALAVAVAVAWRPLYGALIGVGAATHILGDQLGYMGSNLLWPLTRRRTRGFGLFHSQQALPNLLTVWLSGVVLAHHLDQVSSRPVLSPWVTLCLGAVLPAMALVGLFWWQGWRGCAEARGRPGRGVGLIGRDEEWYVEDEANR
jgi:membrane-bound metal-dependent hydrolase YbcI (DUF457 family)